MPKVKSLIICATPLQVMIAERIVALHPEEEFHTLIYSQNEMGAKYEHYASRLAKRCHSARYVRKDMFLTPIGMLIRAAYILYYYIIFWWSYRRMSKVYVSSYECVPMRALFTILGSRAVIYSFDDGLMNLIPSAYKSNKADRPSCVYDSLRLKRPSEICVNLAGHYTIYDAPNAAHPTPIKIDLFTLLREGSLVAPSQEILKIFLGQPVFELEMNGTVMGKKVTETLLQALGCSLYLPHPRENYRVDGVEYIETPLIAEDYLLQELEKHPNRCYTVYSYFSTTLMNLKDHPRIKMVSCRPASVPERWHESYELLERMGIEIREFPNI